MILTEGDSAKATAVAGLGVVGRDFYGVFPLKGKLLNVREAGHAQMIKNEEIQNICKILVSYWWCGLVWCGVVWYSDVWYRDVSRVIMFCVL